jgi:pyocin large subunit-like protein
MHLPGTRGLFLLACLLTLLLLGGCRGATVGPSASASSKPATDQPTPAPAKPAGSADRVDVDRERIAREATWAPGQLRAHFEKHGKEGPWASESQFDASARETIRIGTPFTYMDRESNAERLGFYHRDSNRFTAVTRDGRRITTQFRPDRGEAYVRGLERSSYR